MAPKIQQLNDDEVAWIEQNLQKARDLVERLVPGSTGTLDLPHLDAAFAAWLEEDRTTRDNPNPVINVFGVAFGHCLAEQLALSWVIAADKHGTDLALHGQPGDILIYPANFIAKRYAKKTSGFMVASAEQFAQTVEKVRSQAGHKPWWKIW